MRICHVLEASGGSARVVYELALYGLRQGDDVTVVYSPARADPQFIDSLAALEGVRILICPMQREIGARDLIDAWALWRMLRKAGPFDIIHGHSSKAGALTRLVGLFLPGTVVYTAHAFYSMMPGTPTVYGFIERILSWFTPCVISVSLGEFRHSQGLGINPAKLFLVPNGATPHFTVSREQARRTLGVDDTQVLFGFVGRMASQKNPLRAVASFSQIARTYPKAQLAIIGDGQLRGAVEAERTRLGLEARIDMLGAYDARSVIPGFDCLLGSSDFETLPISFLECLNAGVPIVTTPIGGIEEAIIEGVTGYAAQDFTSESLAAALGRYLALDSAQRREMAAKALQHSKQYSAEIMGEKYRALYCTVLHNKD